MQNKYKHRYMIMIIVDPYVAYNFVIIPNSPNLSDNTNNYQIQITDEQTKLVSVQNFENVSFENDLMYLLLQNTSAFYEGGFFTVKFFFFDEIIYKDKVFGTNQDKDTYNINNNNYSTPDIDNNDYIII